MSNMDAAMGIEPDKREYELVPPDGLAKALLPPMSFQAAFDLYHQRLEDLLRDFQQAVAPAPLSSLISELHTTPSMAHMPQVDISTLRDWLNIRLAGARSNLEYQRLLLVSDALNRFEATAEQFAEWWAAQQGVLQ